jgi:hypothetical protein
MLSCNILQQWRDSSFRFAGHAEPPEITSLLSAGSAPLDGIAEEKKIRLFATIWVHKL